MPFVVLALAAPAARAQDDLRAFLVDYAQAFGCTAGMEMVRTLVVDGMGRTEGDLRAVVEGMTAAGEAEVSADGTQVTLLPPLCEAVGGTSLAMAQGWVESVLTGDEDCRMAVELLRKRTGEEGLPPEAFDRALGELQARGAVVPEGAELVHASCLEGAAGPQDALAQVEAFGETGTRGFVALYLFDHQCRLPLADRDARVKEMATGLAAAMGLAEPVPPEAMEAIRAQVAEVLDNPGPAYEIDGTTGDLVLLQCQP